MKDFARTILVCCILLTNILQSCKKENEDEFPLLRTESPTFVARTSAVFTGTVIHTGSDSIMEKGFCWSPEPGPTLADQSVTNLNHLDAGRMENRITGLMPGTMYYAKAYAINSAGTGYGDQVSFTTKPAEAMTLFNLDLTYDSIQDIDGNTYKTIAIGTQEWMAENLKTTRLSDGTPIPLITVDRSSFGPPTPGYSWYENNETVFKDIYGAFYNWFTVNTSKVCPSGWHVPSDEEWKVMEMFLGMPQEHADALGYRGSNEGEKIKETGTYNWVEESLGGSNLSGFTALPGGESIYGEGNIGLWWTATELWETYSCCRWVVWDASWIARTEILRSSFLSVRCVKD